MDGVRQAAFALLCAALACCSAPARRPARPPVRLQADCRSARGCKSFGGCSYKDGRCVVGFDRDCARSDGCSSRGACTMRRGYCVAGSDRDCARSSGCRNQGDCSARGGRCVVGSDQHCRQSSVCRELGWCTMWKTVDWDGGPRSYCRPASTPGCLGSDLCRDWGDCTFDGTRCSAASDADCRRSLICTRHGICRASGGLCHPARRDASTRAAVLQHSKHLLRLSQDAYVMGYHVLALALAERSVARGHRRDVAYGIFGASACYLKDPAKAVWAWQRAQPRRRRLLERLCGRLGISLTPSTQPAPRRSP